MAPRTIWPRASCSQAFSFSARRRTGWRQARSSRSCTTPLYLVALWHIYLALKPAGRWSSVGPLVLLAQGYCMAPFVHGSFYYIAEFVKLLPLLDAAAQSRVLEAATRATTVLFGTYAVLAVVTIAGFVWMTVVVARGWSLYPRWMAVANPILLMVLGLVVDSGSAGSLLALAGGGGFQSGDAALLHTVGDRPLERARVPAMTPSPLA